MNTKLHAVTDTRGRPTRFFIKAGQTNDDNGAMALLNGLPDAEWPLADRGYDASASAKPCQAEVQSPASQGARRAKSSSDMTRDATGAKIVLNGCSAGSRTGGAWRPAMINAQRSCSLPSLSPHLSYLVMSPKRTKHDNMPDRTFSTNSKYSIARIVKMSETACCRPSITKTDCNT